MRNLLILIFRTQFFKQLTEHKTKIDRNKKHTRITSTCKYEKNNFRAFFTFKHCPL